MTLYKFMYRLIIFLFVVTAIVAGVVYSMESRRDDNAWRQDITTEKPNLQSMIAQQNLQAPENTPASSSVPTPTVPAKLSLEEKLRMAPPSGIELDKSKKYGANIHTTAGDIVVLFNSNEVPATVNNFIYLAKKGFYSDTPFHRTMKGFMIQGGDPQGDGRGGPNYRFGDEKFTGSYTRGTIAMANAGPDTNGSQFFIMHADYGLSPDYTIFGKVVKGIEVVDAIATAPTRPGGEGSTPVNPVVVTSVEVIEE